MVENHYKKYFFIKHGRP